MFNNWWIASLTTSLSPLFSFYQVDHTYDRGFLTKYVDDLRSDLKALVKPHLTEKSLERVDHVLGFFADAELLDSLYIPNRDGGRTSQIVWKHGTKFVFSVARFRSWCSVSHLAGLTVTYFEVGTAKLQFVALCLLQQLATTIHN
jgi:hypothetical protein